MDIISPDNSNTSSSVDGDAAKKINKATQWTPDTLPVTETTASPGGGDVAAHPPLPRDNDHHGLQDKPNDNRGDNPPQPGPTPHCMFPYCWPQGVPAQFTPPSQPVSSSQPQELFRALPSRPQNKAGLFSSEPPFLMGCSVPSGALASMLSHGPGPGPKTRAAADEAGLNEGIRVSGSAPASHVQAVTSAAAAAAVAVAQQGPAWSMFDVDVTELDLGNPGNAASPSCMTLSTPMKAPQGGGQACTYSSCAAASARAWPGDVPCPAPMQRMMMPFSLPPPSLLTLPPGWGPRPPPLPPLPYGLAPHPQSFFHPTACSGGRAPALFQPCPSATDVPDSSSALSSSMEVASSLQQKEEEQQGSPISVDQLNAAASTVAEVDELDVANCGGEEKATTVSGRDAIEVVVDDTSVLDNVCGGDPNGEFIDSSAF